MIDPVQATLLLVIILLSILLIVLGIQVFFILKELRRTLMKATKVLENTEAITESVSEPMSFITNLIFSSKSLSAIGKILRKRDDDGK